MVEQNRAGVQSNVPIELADLGIAGRKDQILGRNGIDHVIGRNVVRLHGLLVEIGLDLKNFAAVRGGNRCAGNGCKLRPDEILSQVEQLHLRQLLARQSQLQDRHRRGIVAQHIGRRDAGR